MFNNQKIIYGFNDLCVLPNIQNTDRQVVPSLDCIRQKNGRSRFLISIYNKEDLAYAKSDKEHTYIARFGELEDKLDILLDRECTNVVPEFTIVEFIKERKLISSILVEGKDKFNISLNILDMTPLLYHLRSSELTEYLSIFNIIYRLYPCNEILAMLNDLKAYGIIIDSSMKEVELKANASVISYAASYIAGMFSDLRFRDSDLFEKSKYGNYSVTSIYNDLDSNGIKSFALGAQFILIDDCTLYTAIQKIEAFEKSCISFLAFVNSSKFQDIYRNTECCLISRY